MNILCVNFGSMWYRKIHEDGGVAWFNTIGVTSSPSGRHLLRLWMSPGTVRFNSRPFPWVSTPKDFVGVRCLTPGIEKLEGETRLLCAKPIMSTEPFDFFLVCVRSDDIGFVDRGSPWRSDEVRLIAASGHEDGRQEMLLLTKPGSWIRSESGFWKLDVAFGPRNFAKLHCRSLGATQPG